MSVLDRDALSDGSLRERMGLPPGLAWSEAQLDESLAGLLASRPPGPVWVFGYGSLMWNPLLHHVERRRAVVPGWHRSFCMRTVVGRGRPERPGRMLSLEPGGVVQGVALCLPAGEEERELRLLWRREMLTGAYLPQWLPLQWWPEGGAAQALVFVARPGHAMHEVDSSVPTVAALVADAEGAFGRNIDYLHALQQALAAEGLQDAHVDALARALQARRG